LECQQALQKDQAVIQTLKQKEMNIVEQARIYAINCHDEVNHTYDCAPYSCHLDLVKQYAEKYKHLIPEEDLETALAACWCHDVIEDTRQTYNDVKNATNEAIAEIVYALTNEKGKTRKERANDKYYNGIRQCGEVAMFVKICDRLANILYSKRTDSTMLDKYRREMGDFKYQLHHDNFVEMFKEMDELLTQTN